MRPEVEIAASIAFMRILEKNREQGTEIWGQRARRVQSLAPMLGLYRVLYSDFGAFGREDGEV